MAIQFFELSLPPGANTQDFERFMLERMFREVSVSGADIFAVSHRLFKSQSDDSVGTRYVWLTFLNQQTLLEPQPSPPNPQLVSASATPEEISNFLAAFGEPAAKVTIFSEVNQVAAPGNTPGSATTA